MNFVITIIGSHSFEQKHFFTASLNYKKIYNCIVDNCDDFHVLKVHEDDLIK